MKFSKSNIRIIVIRGGKEQYRLYEKNRRVYKYANGTEKIRWGGAWRVVERMGGVPTLKITLDVQI